LNTGTAGEFPVVVPLIVSTDIADDIGIDRRQRRIDSNPGVLNTREPAFRLVLVQRVIKFQDRVQRRRGEGRVGYRPREGRLKRYRREGSAILLVEAA
jgi:hypothetical protein